MSRVNLEPLINSHPESKKALRKLEAWLNKRGLAGDITPRELARNVPVAPTELATALSILVDEGILRRVYRAQKPNGVMLVGEFSDPREIPATLPDRGEHYFDTSDADVVPVFKQQVA